MKQFFKCIIVLMPWPVKRFLLRRFFKYELHPSARIGLAWIFPRKLQMDEGCKIDHFTTAIHLDAVIMHPYSSIGRNNWITGFPSGTSSLHFKHQTDRTSILQIGQHSSITKHHHIDCTNTIRIGAFTTIAGYYSQLLTHSIDIYENRQDSKPIAIGDHCFIGTNSVIIGGSALPSYSVLGAKSLLNKVFKEEYMLYAGVPSKPINKISENAAYFNRSTGFVI